jgi:hypothetical protein
VWSRPSRSTTNVTFFGVMPFPLQQPAGRSYRVLLEESRGEERNTRGM